MTKYNRGTNGPALKGIKVMVMSLLFLLIPLLAQGQEIHADFYERSLVVNNIGMAVLGGWALANISTGAYGWAQFEGQSRYFNQMNLFWNTVNLSIAGFALYKNLGTEISMLSGPEMMDLQMKSQRLFLINGAIDVGYIGAGFLLKYLATQYPGNEDRLKGYGNSVILQGSFLFVFDLVLYGLQRNLRMDFLEGLSLLASPDYRGMTVLINF